MQRIENTRESFQRTLNLGYSFRGSHVADVVCVSVYVDVLSSDLAVTEDPSRLISSYLCAWLSIFSYSPCTFPHSSSMFKSLVLETRGKVLSISSLLVGLTDPRPIYPFLPQRELDGVRTSLCKHGGLTSWNPISLSLCPPSSSLSLHRYMVSLHSSSST